MDPSKIHVRLESEGEKIAPDDYLQVIQHNRWRIRALSAMLVVAGALLFSVSAVVAYLGFREGARGFAVLMLASGSVVAIAVAQAILAALPADPTAALSKSELINIQADLYSVELRRGRRGFVLFLVGLCMLSLSLLARCFGAL